MLILLGVINLNYMSLLRLLLCGVSLFLSSAQAEDLKMSEQIFSSYLSQAALPNMSHTLSKTTKLEALATQQEYLRLRHAIDPIGGFALEFTSPDALEKLHLPRGPAVLNALFRSEALSSPAQISLKNSNPFFQHSLETKFGFYLKSTLNHRVYNLQELQGIIEFVTPVLELTYFQYQTPPTLTDLIAANGGYRTWITGHKTSIEHLNMNQQDVVLRYNQNPLYSGKGLDVMGNQWMALMLLINQAIDQGWTLEPDHLLVTGQIGKNIAPQTGSYMVEFGPLGNIELNISN